MLDPTVVGRKNYLLIQIDSKPTTSLTNHNLKSNDPPQHTFPTYTHDTHRMHKSQYQSYKINVNAHHYIDSYDQPRGLLICVSAY
jgi:hypothetical protein